MQTGGQVACNFAGCFWPVSNPPLKREEKLAIARESLHFGDQLPVILVQSIVKRLRVGVHRRTGKRVCMADRFVAGAHIGAQPIEQRDAREFRETIQRD